MLNSQRFSLFDQADSKQIVEITDFAIDGRNHTEHDLKTNAVKNQKRP